jgi:protein SCO1/2
MNTKWIIATFCLFAFLVITTGVVVSQHEFQASPVPRATQHFHVIGIVRGVESNGQTMLVQHEDIPGFMPSMTMPFSLHGTNALRGFAAGDRIRFELTVTKDDSWISQIEKFGTESEPLAHTERQFGENPLEPGEMTPDFALTDQNGKAFHLATFRGKAVLVTFIYTRCPLPNYCPLMTRNFSVLQENLTKEFAGRFHLISISFDPEHDTPEVMKSYAGLFTKDDNSWTFASGNKEQITTVASQFGLVYLPEAGAFTHDLRTALIAPNGRLMHIWRSNVWTPDEIQQRVAEVLHEGSFASVRHTSSAFQNK